MSTTTARQIPICCPGHTRPLAELQFCSPPDEHRTFLVSACHDKMPMIRDAISGDWIGTWAGHKGAVWSTKLDPNGYIAATASGDFSVKLWDGVTGKELFTYPHKHIVKTVDFSCDSKRLCSGGHEGLLRIFNLEEGARAIPIVLKQSETEKVNITKCVWLDDKIVLASGSDGKVRFWEVDTGKLLLTLSVKDEVRDLEICKVRDDTILTVAAGEIVTFFKVLRVTDENAPIKGDLLHAHKVPAHFREEGGASLHPSGKKFVTGASDLWVRVFSFETGEELECHRGHHGPIRCLRYAPDGKTYASGSEDGTIRLWKTDPTESTN